MTKLTPKRKPFRRKMWAVLDERNPEIDPTFYEDHGVAMALCDFYSNCRIARVLITELPRKGRDGK